VLPQTTISDEGIRTPTEEIAKLSHPFVRARARASTFAGIGLGLYVARIVAGRMPGCSRSRATGTAKGTTLWVKLPCDVLSHKMTTGMLTFDDNRYASISAKMRVCRKTGRGDSQRRRMPELPGLPRGTVDSVMYDDRQTTVAALLDPGSNRFPGHLLSRTR
jgi:hypothetical protein